MTTPCRIYVERASSLIEAQNLPDHFTPPMILLKRHGRDFNTHGPAEGFDFGIPKMCFQNSLRLILANHHLTYCEGYAQPATMPGWVEHHAWCVDKRGNVIDTTWREGGLEYFGLAFETITVIRCAEAMKDQFALLFNPEALPLYQAPPEGWLRRHFHTDSLPRRSILDVVPPAAPCN